MIRKGKTFYDMKSFMDYANGWIEVLCNEVYYYYGANEDHTTRVEYIGSYNGDLKKENE